MRGLLGSGLCLALGLAAVAARAEDGQWRPATPPENAAPASPRGVSLRRPVPLETGAASAPVTPVSFSTDGAPRPLVRAKAFEPGQPMPVGPPAGGGDRRPGI